MRMSDVPQRGKRGKLVASRNRFGPYLKELVPPEQPGTAAQQAAWDNMTELSWLWNQLSEQRRDAWRRQAEQLQSRRSLGQSGPLDGVQLFKKINRVLRTCGREPLLDPPPRPAFGPNPVVGFSIRERRGALALKLKLSPKLRWEARPAREDLMLFAWAPCNAGAAKNSLYAFLGLAPPPRNGEIDFTNLYLNKLKEWRKLAPKRYHLPLEGSRIFIRVWQQTDGWEYELGMFRADALVPVPKWLHPPWKKPEK